MKKTHLDIIDPIHNFIRANDLELKIIDTSIFQRLRRIRQLTGAHLVYPGAQHTRFEHSLGVMHISSMACHALQEKNFLTEDDTSQIRLAGLLHDVGHGPFSHLFEEVLQKKKISHEQIGKKIILDSEIGDIISKSNFDKKNITDLAFGQSKKPFMNEIISGILSADMMDYLLRDGYFTGAEHAKIDHNRITQSLEVHKKKLALERSSLYSFESMMHSRYQMFKAVYFHKTVRSAEVMLLEAIEMADDEFEFSNLTPEQYVKHTDDSVLSELIHIKSDKPKLQRAKQFAQDYQNRNLLKCVFERFLTIPEKLDQINIDEIRQKISKKSAVKSDEIFVDTSVTPSLPLSSSKKEPHSITLISEQGKSIQEIPISEIPLVSTMAGFMNILRIYTTSKNRKKVEIAANSILGELR